MTGQALLVPGAVLCPCPQESSPLVEETDVQNERDRSL